MGVIYYKNLFLNNSKKGLSKKIEQGMETLCNGLVANVSELFL